MKHNTMKKLTEEPLQEINIKQTCICEGINRMAKRVKYIETVVKEGDKIVVKGLFGLQDNDDVEIKNGVNK